MEVWLGQAYLWTPVEGGSDLWKCGWGRLCLWTPVEGGSDLWKCGWGRLCLWTPVELIKPQSPSVQGSGGKR